MSHEHDLRRAHEAAVLERMRTTRVQLGAADTELRMADASRRAPRDARGVESLSASNVARALFAAPRVTLLASVALAAVFLGPRRVVPVVVRTGLTSWVSRNVRAVVQG